MNVWIHLLLLATYKVLKVDWCGKTITLNPGQLITGRKELSKKAGVHESSVYRVLKRMEIEHQIEQQVGNKSSIITIVNWEDYQSDEQESEQQANSKRTASEQQANTNKNNKNNKNVVIASNESITTICESTLIAKNESDLVKFLRSTWSDIKDPVGLETRAKNACPGVDLLAEAKRALLWEKADPKHRKVKHETFLVNWWNRSQQNASRYNIRPPLSDITPNVKGDVEEIGRKNE